MRYLVWGIAASLASVVAVPTPARADALPPVKHVFVIVLENKNSSETFATNSPAPYLAHTLTAQGQFLANYYGIGHASLDNYIAMVSGQAPNPDTQGDCQFYTDFVGPPGVVTSPGQAVGQGCVYPATVKTLADQLAAKGLTWKGYMEDMGTPCRHPALNAQDDTQQAKASDQYAARHNPFVYFHSIIDTPACAANDVPLDRLPADLASTAATPNLSFITPDLCNDGHDATCVDGGPGGLVAVDLFLKTWVPRILASPAYLQGGMLLITFDEAEVGNASTDATACCGETNGPNSPMPGISGPGGGKTSAVVLSPWALPGSVNNTPYNHYSFLRSMEDLFGLDHLGFAAANGLVPFGPDVFNGPGPVTASGAGTGATLGSGGGAGSGTATGANGRGALPATGGQPSPWFALGLLALALALASAATRRSVATQSRVPQPSCQRTFLRSFPGRHG
jgi:hypothetical protein